MPLWTAHSGRGTMTSTGILEPYLKKLSLEWESFHLSPEVGRGSDPSSLKCITKSHKCHSQGGRDTAHHPGTCGHGYVSVRAQL